MLIVKKLSLVILIFSLLFVTPIQAYTNIEQSENYESELQSSNKISSLRPVSEIGQIPIQKLEDLILLNSVTFQFETERFEIIPQIVKVKDMDLFYEVDENGNYKKALLNQIYIIKSYIRNSNGDQTLQPINVITDGLRFLADFQINDVYYDIDATLQIASIPSLLANHELKKMYRSPTDLTSISSQLDESSLIEASITASSATFTAKMVIAGSRSFLTQHGSGWAARLVDLFEGGCDCENPYGFFKDGTPPAGPWLEWIDRRYFVFSSGGPSSSNSDTFIGQWDNFIGSLPNGDPIFPFHSAVLFSGHEFDDGVFGSVPVGGIGDFWLVDCQNGCFNSYSGGFNHQPLAVITDAFPNTVDYSKRITFAHELGHLMGGHHTFAEYMTDRCGFLWLKTTFKWSLMKSGVWVPFKCSNNHNWAAFQVGGSNWDLWKNFVTSDSINGI